jgi:hypothetical protein
VRWRSYEAAQLFNLLEGLLALVVRKAQNMCGRLDIAAMEEHIHGKVGVMRRWIGVSVIGLLLLSATDSAAQEGPAAAADIPAPEECTIKPRSFGFFETLATPVTGTPVPGGAEEGTPADAETVAAVTATIREELACANAQDLRRFAALHTKAGLVSLFADSPEALTRLPELAATTPVPAPEDERNALYTVHDVVELPDGRVRAIADLYDISAEPGDVRYAYILVESRGRWLIDEVSKESANAATPTP